MVVINTFTDPICPTPTTMSTELTAGSPTIIAERSSSNGNSQVYIAVVIAVAVVVTVVIICALFIYKKKFGSKMYIPRYVCRQIPGILITYNL